MAKILYVEDNEMNRDMLSRRLQRREHEILLAFDGKEGLEMMKSEKPDLVLMDMGLPVMDGWEATTTAKADPEIQDIPIIALTAHALESDRVKALECGADDFDTKPVDFKRLLEKIEGLLS
jgi:CheY-like chemotaxis protein|tara:strand:- start:8483 stop:8845 length:363 start_codon:yes stop_codon:yes gene_type:complete